MTGMELLELLHSANEEVDADFSFGCPQALPYLWRSFLLATE